MLDTTPIACSIARGIRETYERRHDNSMNNLFSQILISDRKIKVTYGGVSNPIIIICARALKKDQLHCE